MTAHYFPSSIPFHSSPLFCSLDMDDNDEDGDEDGFSEALEAYEKEKKTKKSEPLATVKKADTTAMKADDSAGVPVPVSAVSAVAASKAEEEDAKKAVTMGSLSMDAVEDEDALVSAMQSASISGSRISDMPTP